MSTNADQNDRRHQTIPRANAKSLKTPVVPSKPSPTADIKLNTDKEEKEEEEEEEEDNTFTEMDCDVENVEGAAAVPTLRVNTSIDSSSHMLQKYTTLGAKQQTIIQTAYKLGGLNLNASGMQKLIDKTVTWVYKLSHCLTRLKLMYRTICIGCQVC